MKGESGRALAKGQVRLQLLRIPRLPPFAEHLHSLLRPPHLVFARFEPRLLPLRRPASRRCLSTQRHRLSRRSRTGDWPTGRVLRRLVIVVLAAATVAATAAGGGEPPARKHASERQLLRLAPRSPLSQQTRLWCKQRDGSAHVTSSRAPSALPRRTSRARTARSSGALRVASRRSRIASSAAASPALAPTRALARR